MSSVVVGVSGICYAPLLTDTGTAVTYGPVVQIPGAINVTINPNATIETLFADDGPSEVATSLGAITVEMGLKYIPYAAQAALLGHTVTAGVMNRKSTDIPPWVALGFKALKSDGSYRFIWLVKGKFQLPEMSHETKAEGVNFQTQSITGSFVKRDTDNLWMKQGDTSDAAFLVPAQTAWFTLPTIVVP